MLNTDRSNLALCYDHMGAHLGEAEELAGKGRRQTHAAVACRIIRNAVGGMQCYSGPCQALHERHRRAAVYVRPVKPVLLQDAEDTRRRGVALLAGGNPRRHENLVALIDGRLLVRQRHDDLDRVLLHLVGIPGRGGCFYFFSGTIYPTAWFLAPHRRLIDTRSVPVKGGKRVPLRLDRRRSENRQCHDRTH